MEGLDGGISRGLRSGRYASLPLTRVHLRDALCVHTQNSHVAAEAILMILSEQHCQRSALPVGGTLTLGT